MINLYYTAQIMEAGKKQGQELLKALVSQGHYIFNTETARQICKTLGVSEGYVLRLLSSLVRQGWLMRLRRGLYAGTGQLPGHFNIPVFAIATHLVSPSAISHWSALHHHGLTEQIPKHITAMTPQRITPPSQYQSKKRGSSNKHSWEVAGIIYEYICVKPNYFFGTEKIWLDEYFCIDITDKERTVLEMFASPRYFGGMGETIGVLMASLDELHLNKLVQYALQYNNAAVIKRLGWTLEHLGVPQAHTKPLCAFPITGYRLLDPTKNESGRYNKRWMIQENLVRKDK